MAAAVPAPEASSSRLSRGSKDVLFGSLAGMAAKLFEHPFDLVKVRLQTAHEGAYAGPLQCAQRTLSEEGVRGIYRVSARAGKGRSRKGREGGRGEVGRDKQARGERVVWRLRGERAQGKGSLTFVRARMARREKRARAQGKGSPRASAPCSTSPLTLACPFAAPHALKTPLTHRPWVLLC
jgi:hypothetical protein